MSVIAPSKLALDLTFLSIAVVLWIDQCFLGFLRAESPELEARDLAGGVQNLQDHGASVPKEDSEVHVVTTRVDLGL